jgi:hypothetical protein
MDTADSIYTRRVSDLGSFCHAFYGCRESHDGRSMATIRSQLASAWRQSLRESAAAASRGDLILTEHGSPFVRKARAGKLTPSDRTGIVLAGGAL